MTALWLAAAAVLGAQPRQPMQARLEDSAEAAWAKKKVHARRALDISTLKRVEAGFDKTTVLRLAIPGEDWTAYNRLAIRISTEVRGFPMLPLVVAMRNDGVVKVPDVYGRDGIHYVQLPNNRSAEILWEIEPLARDRVTSLEINYWPNKPLPHPTDYVRYTVESIHLQRVTPDVHEGWDPGAGKLAYSHSGYPPSGKKTAIAGRGAAREFAILDEDGKAVFRAPSRVVKSRLGEFTEFDFSTLRAPGVYTLRAGSLESRPFRIGEEVWESSILKTLNFFYAERCGFEVPGMHQACHRDWLATHGDRKIVMNGGWHDAGDLSQGLINTAEATYAMFALARKLEGRNGALIERLIEEGRWGLDWVLRVRFDGGYRMGFASMNVWTNGIIGDADDRSREALNNANVNYLAASAEAIAYQALKSRDPALAARALHTAEQDWEYAVEGKDTAETQHTPAFATVEMELASVGILASLELYEATGKPRYADKARELAEIVLASQRKAPAGRDFPQSGFFYNSPAQRDIFHQFHRGNDQAPIVALARLCETFPGDPARPSWQVWWGLVARNVILPVREILDHLFQVLVCPSLQLLGVGCSHRRGGRYCRLRVVLGEWLRVVHQLQCSRVCEAHQWTPPSV
jgi:hypothetical protein